jgi:hypothetical protein
VGLITGVCLVSDKDRAPAAWRRIDGVDLEVSRVRVLVLGERNGDRY